MLKPLTPEADAALEALVAAAPPLDETNRASLAALMVGVR